MKELATLLIFVSPIAALLFIIRIVVASFSTKVSEQVRKHLKIHILWGCLAAPAILVFLGILSPNTWPLRLINRHYQRAEIAKRVQSGGGWAALQKDCEVLADQHQDSEFFWFRRSATNLPPSIAALNPLEVRFDPPRLLHELNEPQFSVVHIKIFGNQGKSGDPFLNNFWLEVVCGTNAESYRPKPARDGFERVNDRIYEVY